MPDPPDVSLFSRFVLQNPWPLTIALLAIAAGIAWLGLREGKRNPLNVAGALALLAFGVLITGLLTTTPAEHGMRVTRQLVNAAIAADVRGALALIADDAVFTSGSPRNPGYDRYFIEGRLNSLPRYEITGNRITSIKGYTADADTAVVHLGCSTSADGFPTVATKWVVRVERQPDDEWLITRLTFVSIGQRSPPDRWW